MSLHRPENISLHSTQARSTGRRGAFVIEMLLALMILLICTLAIVQWTFTTCAVQAVDSAAAEGARTAAGVFSSAAARTAGVQATVLAVLTPMGFQSTGLTVGIVDSGTHFSVTVTIPVTSSPIPQLLNSFGFTALTGKSLRSTGVAWAT
jgi:Flp pilus assembly protein TadG